MSDGKEAVTHVQHETEYQRKHPETFARFLWRQKVILAGAFVGYVCAYLVRNNFKLMSNSMVEQYGWSKLNVATLLTCFAVTYGIGKFVMGALADRTSLRKLFGGALALSAILCIVMGFIHNFWVIVAVLLVVGLIQGALAPSSQAMIAKYFPNHTRGGAVAGWNVSQNVGSALLPLIIAWRRAIWRSASSCPVCSCSSSRCSYGSSAATVPRPRVSAPCGRCTARPVSRMSMRAATPA